MGMELLGQTVLAYCILIDFQEISQLILQPVMNMSLSHNTVCHRFWSLLT